MDAVQVIWSAPRGGVIFKSKYELLTAVLSALEWKKHNGKIILFTDCSDSIGDWSDFVWDEVKELGDIPVNPEIFWAAGKLYAMKNMTVPFCMLDTDFIVWKKLSFEDRLCAIHEEEPDIYPDYPEIFENKGFSKTVKPVNTAFTYINDDVFLKLYTDEALSFMESYSGEKDFLKPMIFAEQRMFSMCAEGLGIKINILSDLERLFKDGHDGHFTHLWGFKSQMNNDKKMKEGFEKKLEERIKNDFPECYTRIKEVIKNGF